MTNLGGKNLNKLIPILIAALMIAVTTACGGAKTTAGLSGASNLDAEGLDLSEISQKLDVMEVEVFNVSQELAALDLQNPLNLLGDGLKDSVKKFSGVIKDLQEKIEELKIKISNQLSKLDPNDPQQQKLIVKLEEVLEYLDNVSNHLDEVVIKVEQKIDALFAKINKKIEDKLSGIQEFLAKLALDKLKDSVLGHLIGL